MRRAIKHRERGENDPAPAIGTQNDIDVDDGMRLMMDVMKEEEDKTEILGLMREMTRKMVLQKDTRAGQNTVKELTENT